MRTLFVCTVFICMILTTFHSAALLVPAQPTKDDGPKRIDANAAEAIMRQYFKVNPKFDVPVKELTTPAVWDKLKVQVFQIAVTAKFNSRAAVVIKAGKASSFGYDFGGEGVDSLCVADLKGDGNPLLVFSCGFGSGVHRSQVGVIDVHAKEPNHIMSTQSLELDFDHDWKVRTIDGKSVLVEGGGVYFGDLVLSDKDGKAELNVRLAPSLPEGIKRNVKTR